MSLSSLLRVAPVIACLLLSTAWAQKISKHMVRFANTITEEELAAHEMFLADTLLEARETGQRGQHAAALYIAASFKRLGLKPIPTAGPQQPGNGFTPAGRYYQPYFLQKSAITAMEISMGGTAFTWKKDFFTFGSRGIPDTMAGEWVFAGYATDSAAPKGVQDKIALVMGSNDKTAAMRARDKTEFWFDSAKILRKAGAKAIFFVVSDSDFLVYKGYARTSSENVVERETDNGFPLVFITPAMAGALFVSAGAPTFLSVETALRKGESPEVSLAHAAFSYQATVTRSNLTACNVLGYLEGTDKKDELLVISAHHDHIGITSAGVNVGADDDASGTSALLELADAFSQAAAQGHRPRRSILFLSVSGEEKGLFGSEYYTDHPVYSLASTVADLNIDMIGRVGSEYIGKSDSLDYVYLIGSDKLSPQLHALSESANASYGHMKLDYTYNNEDHPSRFYYRSDHYNFAKNNIPIIFYFSGTHADYHKPTDTPDKLHFDKMVKTCHLVFATAWEIANREARLPVDAVKQP